MYVDKLDNVEEYHVENFGCRASQSDGESIAAQLRARKLNPASSVDSASVIVVNTCSVTSEAERNARAFIRRARRRNPHAKIVVTGCYAQRAPDEVAALEGVNSIIGNSHKAAAAEICTAPGSSLAQNDASLAQSSAFLGLVPVSALAGREPQVFVDQAFAHADLSSLPFAFETRQTRPNLKAQDGCANRCSFCIIPFTRGPSRSVPLATCLENVRRFVENGGQELILSGINLGRWGRDLTPAQQLVDLVTAILTLTDLPRIRLSSIEPMDWTPDLLALFREYATGEHPRLAPHAHLPLQSGSDAILRKMHRRYRPWHYAERTAAIRAASSTAAIGADVMVGFPGETEALFEESYRFIESQPFTYLHLFPFSARPGTPGWEMHREEPVPPAAVRSRMTALRALIEQKNLEFRSKLIDTQLSVVTLNTTAEVSDRQCTSGMSDNFIPVEIAGKIEPNAMLPIRVTGQTAHGLSAEVANGTRSISRNS